MRRQACHQCSRTISSRDTVVVDHGELSHLDCENPRALSAKERALLVYYCWDHTIGECPVCASRFCMDELASDFLDNRTYVCPHCSTDLTNDVRRHLYDCPSLPREVRRRAQAAREVARDLVKQSRQLCDAAEVLVGEADVALSKSRKLRARSVRSSE
jgi:hypothetical protein